MTRRFSVQTARPRWIPPSFHPLSCPSLARLTQDAGRCAGCRVLVLAALLWLALTAIARGESPPQKPPAEQVTVEGVQNRLRQLEDAPALDAAAKGKLRGLYGQALDDLGAADKWANSAKRFEQMAATGPEELLKTKAALDALPRETTLSIPEASLLQLEQTLSQKAAELSEQKLKFAEIEAEPKRRASRRIEIPKLVVALRERLADVDNQLQAAAPTSESSELTSARRLSLWARRRAVEQELLCYENELKAYEVCTELLPLQRDLAARQIALAEQELAKWQEAINKQRQRDVEVQWRRAQQEAQQAHPALAELTKQNAELAERRKNLAELIVQTTTQLEDTNQKLTALQDQFKRIQGKVETVGLTNAIGLSLRKQREAMPDLRNHRKNIKTRQLAIRESNLALLQFEDRRSELANLEAQIQKELHTTAHAQDNSDQYELEAATRNALQTEKDYLDALIVDLNSYFEKLQDLDFAERQLIKQTEDYAKYIDERVLWIRSAAVLGLSDCRHLAEAALWLIRPEAWFELLRSLLADVQSNPLLAAMAVLIFGPLIWIQPRLRRKTTEIGERAQRANCCSLIPTLEAVLLTVLISSVVPGILWYVSWRLGAGIDSPEFSKAVAAGLAYTAGIYLVLDLLRQKCRPEGLSEAHFGWPVSALKPSRRYIQAAKILLLPFVFIAVTISAHENDRWIDSLGRLSFVAAMLICSLLVQRSLRPTGGIYQAALAIRRGGWVERLRPVWYPLAVLVPVALAILAVAGYYYTAQQLAQRLVTSAYILLGLTLLRSLLLRWVLVKRRKLAIEQFRQRRAANQAEAKPTGESDASFLPAAAEQNVDLAAINAQTRHLVEYSLAVTGFLGIWLVWVDVLPALWILDRIALWQTSEQAQPVSLADLGLAVLIAATMLIAAKNIPGLLEMAVLQHLPLDAGFRYTVGTVSRYLIVVIGVVLACHTIGLSWAKVQWLVAAVSLGLGFGLQEIFANFVSGLIILFERPVRVGDVVTVDDVSGVISRIRMRATTITNWDRQEFIVPNKEFITGRVLNWTLSDQVNRVVVNVGIAYGSDTDLAAALLLKAAREHPLVLDDPGPRVTFQEFGPSSLNFVLRCYLPDLENRLQVIHDLHTTVNRQFRQAGIEIAFPQHDVHIRSILSDQRLLDGALQGRSPMPHVVEEDAENQRGVRKVA